QHLVEDIVGRLDAGGARRQLAHLAAMRQQAAKERHRLMAGELVAGYGNKQRTDLLRSQLEMIRRPIYRKAGRPWIEMQRGAARLAVEPLIIERNIDRTNQLAGTGASSRTLFAAHFEQIGEIIVEQQRHVEARGGFSVILQPDALI